jgi:hypothetical protein
VDIPNILPGLTGWPATLLTLFSIIAYGWYIKRASKSKAEEIATSSYEKAITAMQTYSDILGKRLEEAEKETTRINLTVATIYAALKARGIHVTIDGEMITIRDTNGISTTMAIKG